MSGTHSHGEMLPRGTLVLAGALVAFALSAASFVRIADIPPAASPVLMREQAGIRPVKSRDLRFVDRADGAVVIEDVRGGIAAVVVPGQQTGFIRGVMRGLARERRAHGIGNGPSFKLTLWADGELSLVDSATGRALELTAFGTTNRATFAALLDAHNAKSVDPTA
ncbi:photosynthetic complex assembly protein PuhC [Sphingomonas hengshuiensis]|uniref:Phosphonoacetaldehyde methylase n=1 Tax=Sphingomonas hengshuiensis TaxID=1609977 RepID=A0A7U5BF08_9SPHN|nr:photosynthetic complex assembly protein PuhC [Sphingomonas hengshuiensis]AJP74045.1 phosphonoacetaldehyde methylase [Sphingomonas hengshuiensis]